MKRYLTILLSAGVLFIAAILLLVLMTSGSYTASREHITALNDIARTAEAHRTEFDVLEQTDFPATFVILDMTDHVLYANAEAPDRISVETAIQKSYPYRYLTDESSVWGSVILLEDGMERYRLLRTRMIAGMSVCALLLLLGMVCFGIYLDRHIIAPFRRMKDFAGKVAEGQFDTPLAMDRDNLFGAFSESFDIMREELAASRQRELDLQKKERELVASLSHDLKTPVTGIQLAAEVLQMRLSVKAETSGEEIVFQRDEITSMTEGVEGILQKSGQINALVSDLFATTLDDLGEFKVSCRDENAAVLGELVKSCDDRHLAVMGEIPAVIVQIDTRRMAQVIGNIISNSYKYANTAIDTEFRLSEGFLEMRLQDHGPGVPQDELELITNKFYRGKAWKESDTDGNGLGLYIARMLMKKMDGDLIAESDGDGLAITLVIPLS
ncbi:MAG: HAMP domain-containing histidine kinase [Oscillospiraceae bacterium]|nr:HAMP domain-containing histidine kinase [Oscillospiraceae bacterium]